MESATTVLLIASFLGIGLFMFLAGVRGAIKSWKGREEDGI
ncbi:MAG: hypothetical protein QNL49_03060 [Actinomycetota bacterium]|jgi:hypothetical protein|tara:strand:+ start:118 stop:240 length:123 start_codon:yes stop_codon:yes gene_type:complete